MNATPPVKEMQRAYLGSDRSYDGVFYLGVRTTGIFCRPSCPARKPKPENVEYFATPRAAVFAGYRPCKRCRPMTFAGRSPAWVERLLHDLETNPTTRLRDHDLRQRGIDPVRARRYFQEHYGMTFQAYSRGRRLGSALEQIRNGARLDAVALGNGYESNSGFRDAFARTFGLPPGQSTDSDYIRLTWLESPLGPLLAGATAEGVCLLEFTDRRMLETQFAVLRQRFKCAIVPGVNDHLRKLKAELAQYFAGEREQFSVPLVFPGSPFQRRVWEELQRLPFGATRSYEDVARAIGSPRAVRAVGTANGQNRIAILLPCHRVVNKDGKLGGYGGGLWRKQFLLDLERSTK